MDRTKTQTVYLFAAAQHLRSIYSDERISATSIKFSSANDLWLDKFSECIPFCFLFCGSRLRNRASSKIDGSSMNQYKKIYLLEQVDVTNVEV